MEADSTRSVALFHQLTTQLSENVAIQDSFAQLVKIWSEVWPEDEVKERQGIVVEECINQIHDFLGGLLTDEVEKKDVFIRDIERSIKTILELQTDLSIAIPHDDVVGLPLQLMAHTLGQRLKKYQTIQEESQERLRVLKEEEEILCDKLGMTPNTIDSNKTPSEEVLKSMSQHLQCLRDEERQRMLQLNISRTNIMQLYEELGTQPHLVFEKQLLSDEYLTFKLSHKVMTQVKEIEQRLFEQVDKAKETVNNLITKLNNVWTYLEHSDDCRNKFLNQHQGYSVCVVDELKKELKKWEAVKRENIQTIIVKMRKILQDEWNKCMISKEERKKFTYVNSDCYTEDLCDLHEFEIDRLRKYYENHEKIFTSYAKWQQLFDRLLTLQKNNTNNANRYKNRGCTLLQEEKERNKIRKDLPRIEEDLKKLLQQYKDEKKEPFTCFGQNVEQKMEEQWEAHFSAKSAEVLTRVATSAKVGSNYKRLCPTPSETLTASAKKGKFVSDCKSKTPITRVRSQQNIDYRKKSQRQLNFENVNYDEFENGIQTRSVRSSSLTNLLERSKVLQELNGGDCDLGHYTSARKNTPSKLSTPKITLLKSNHEPSTFPRQNTRTNLPRTPSKQLSRTPYLSTTRNNKLPHII